MKAWLLFSLLGATWTVAQGSASNGFMMSIDQPSSLEDQPLIPRVHSLGMLEDNVLEEHVDAPEGGSAPWAERKVHLWPEQSALPKSVQWGLGGLWIAMLASLPFIIPIVDQKPVTKTQIVVGSMMLVVLFGGFYLFTNIILFQSVHFKQIRPLTIVECIYLMSQLITTVGYGDITPAKIRGQVFVGLYVLGALFVIAMVVSDMTKHVVKMAQDYKNKRWAGTAEEQAVTHDLGSLIKPAKPPVTPLLLSLAVFAFIDICWIIFFSTYPGENKTVFQATYMSVITLSTVGLGWFTPITEAGMIFGAFWMLFGSAALVSVIGNFTELMIKLNQYERFQEDSKDEAMNSLKFMSKGSDEVTELQFYQFCLHNTGIHQDVLDHIHEAFEQLAPKNGTVNVKKIQQSLEESALSPRKEGSTEAST